MPSSVPLKRPEVRVPLPVLRRMITYALDLDVLLRHLSDERNLISEDAATLIAKLAQQYRSDLAPLTEQLERAERDATAGTPSASA